MYIIKIIVSNCMPPGEIKTPDHDRARNIFVSKVASGAIQVAQGMRDDFKVEIIDPDNKVLKTVTIQSENPATNDKR